MKILALVSNFLLLGVAFLGILTGGRTSNETMNIFFRVLLFLVPVIDIIFMLESRVNYGRLAYWTKKRSNEKESPSVRSSIVYLYMKIAAILLNLLLIFFIYKQFDIRFAIRWNLLMAAFTLFVILTPVLSLVTISMSQANKFKDVKRDLIISTGSVVGLITCFFLAMYIWVGQAVKERIYIAKQQYGGIAEDALLAYLNDTTHSPRERTDIAIWTLGKIRSRKAMPVLKKLYKDDPTGLICKGHHDKILCQYEIHKAIVSIEHGWKGDKKKNRFGSWARLNK